MDHSDRRRVELTSRVYDCALEWAQWGAVLDEVRSALGFATALLRISAADGRDAGFHASAGVAPEFLSCADEYRNDIPKLWGGNERLNRAPLGIPLVLSHQPEAWRRNRFTWEWTKPQGVDDGVTVPLARSGAHFSRVVFGLGRRQGQVGQDQTDMLRALAPHMRRSLQVAELLAAWDETGPNLLEARFEPRRPPCSCWTAAAGCCARTRPAKGWRRMMVLCARPAGSSAPNRTAASRPWRSSRPRGA